MYVLILHWIDAVAWHAVPLNIWTSECRQEEAPIPSHIPTALEALKQVLHNGGQAVPERSQPSEFGHQAASGVGPSDLSPPWTPFMSRTLFPAPPGSCWAGYQMPAASMCSPGFPVTPAPTESLCDMFPAFGPTPQRSLFDTVFNGQKRVKIPGTRDAFSIHPCRPSDFGIP